MAGFGRAAYPSTTPGQLTAACAENLMRARISALADRRLCAYTVTLCTLTVRMVAVRVHCTHVRSGRERDMREISRLPFGLRVLSSVFVMLAAALPFSIAPLEPGATLAAGACPGDISNVSASSLSSESIPAEYTGDWNVAYALGDITSSQRTKAGGGIVDEDIGHEALNFTFNVDKHGYASGKGKAIYHFDVKAYSVAFPDQVSAHAYLVGNRQRRVFTLQGRACGDGKIRVESTKVPDLLLFNGTAQTSIGAWNIFPPQDETIAEVDKHLTITSTAYVKPIKMHM